MAREEERTWPWGQGKSPPLACQRGGYSSWVIKDEQIIYQEGEDFHPFIHLFRKHLSTAGARSVLDPGDPEMSPSQYLSPSRT